VLIFVFAGTCRCLVRQDHIYTLCPSRSAIGSAVFLASVGMYPLATCDRFNLVVFGVNQFDTKSVDERHRFE
jgi:hypothetical protein